MRNKIAIILLCSVAISLASLFTVTQLMAGEKIGSEKIRNYQGRITQNELQVEKIKKRYTRDPKTGCVSKVQFYNDPENCRGNKDCPTNQEPGWIDAIEPNTWPIIWGERLVGAGISQGESGPDACLDWRFTVAGSPGWDCDYIAGHIYCSCIGYYYAPRDWCCDPLGCRPRP